MKKIYITVRNQFDAIHKYENAPDEVDYLRNPHRHTFYITSKIQTFHEDRELEFYMVKDFIHEQIPALFDALNEKMSCENIASFIVECLTQKYCTEQFREMEISVSEDQQNEATVVVC